MEITDITLKTITLLFC